MSRTIDERIVEMQFNNQQFEQNVKVSMGTLDKLKQALNFGRGKNGFDDLNASARKFDMSGVSNAVTEVHSKFSALEIVGVTALVNIANQAINTGKHMLNSLTIAPISQGFQEYELKMGSVQTIVASTGEKLSTVNKYLEDLNTYSDKTIYSFKDMTSNIGKFTNAGVKLKDAVAAIKGVSNVAAVSGANAAEASRAMYNFSQALSSGAVKLIDWKSIENANMSTVEFKNTLLDTAVALGTVVKEGDSYRSTTGDLQGKVSDLFTSTKGFNDSLSHQWMTTEVLTQALELYATDVRELNEEERKTYEERLRRQGFDAEQIKRFEELGIKAADAATEVKTFSMLMDTLREAVGSGWAQTWEILFGDFEEAKKLWTEINDVVGGFIDRQSKARNDLLKAWAGDEIKGREKLIQGLSNAFKVLQNVTKPVTDAFAQLFPPLTAKKLGELTDKFVAFTEKAKKATENFPMNLFNNEETKTGVKELDKVIEKTEAVGKTAKETTEKVGKSIEEIRSAVRAVVRGDYGNGMPGDRQEALKRAGFDPKAVQSYVDKVHELGKGTWTLSDEIMAAAEESLGLTQKASSEAEATTQSIMQVEEKVSDVVTKTNLLTSVLVSVGQGIKNIFGSTARAIGTFVGAFDEAESSVTVTRQTVVDFYKSIDKFADKLKISDKALKQIHNTGKKFFVTLKTLASLVVKFTLENLPAALDIVYSILRVVGKLGLGIISLITSLFKAFATSKLLRMAFDGLGFVFRQLSKVFEGLADIVDYFGDKLDAAREYMSDYIEEHETLQKLTSIMARGFNRAGDAVTGFGKNLGDRLGIHTIAEFKDKVDGLIDSLSKNFFIPGFENFISTIDKAFNGTLKLPSVIDFFTGIADSIQKFVDKKTVFDGFEDAISELGNGFAGLKDLTKDFKDGTIPTLDKFKFAFDDFINSISKALGRVDWVGVAAVVGQIGTMVIAFEAIVTVAKAMSTAKGLVKTATGTMTAIKGFFGKVSGILDQFTVSKTWVSKFRSVAKSVVILSAAIYIVAQALIQVAAIPEDQLIRAGIAVAAIAGALVVMEILLSKAGKGIEVGTAASIIGFAAAIKLIVSALSDMANLLVKFNGDTNTIANAFDYLIIIIGLMLGTAAVLALIQTKIGGLGSVGGMATLVGFVIALKLLVTVLNDIAKLKIDNGWSFLGKLVVAVVTLGIIARAASKVKFGGGVGLIAAVLALKLLVTTLDDIASIDMSKILANLGAFVMVGITMLAIVGVMRLAGENAAKAGIGILAIAVALKLLVGTIKILGEMDPATAAKGIVAVQALMLSIGGLMLATAVAGQYAIRAGVSILLISIALNLLVIPVFLLGSMKASTALKGVFALLGLMAGVFVLLIGTAAAGPYALQASVAILLITAALTGMVYAVYMLGNIESSKLFKAVAAIGALSLIFAGLMVVTKHTGNSSWTGILAIAGAVAILAGSLVILANIPLKNLAAAIGSLAIIGVLMQGLMMASQYTSNASVKKIILMGIVIVALAGSMAAIAYAIKDVNGGNMVAQFSAMAIALVSIGGVLAVLSALKVSPRDAAKAGVAFDVFAVLIGGLIAIVGSLSALDSANVGPMLERLGNAGKLIGNFIHGIMEGIAGDKKAEPKKIEETKTFAERISELVDTLVEAADKISGKEASLESLKGLVDVIGAFAKAEFINGISEILGGGKTDFASLGTQLAKLADGLTEFSKKMAEAKIDPTVTDQALRLAKGLAELYGMDDIKSGGFIHRILGESIGLDKLGDQLKTIAEGLNDYVKEVNKIKFDDATIDKSKKLLTFLAELYGMEDLKSGGFLQKLVGSSIGLDTLGSQLKSLAAGMKEYIDELDGVTITDEQISSSKKLLTMLADIQGAPGLRKGGLLGEFVGNQMTLSTFGSSLGALSQGISEYAKNINTTVFTPDKIEASKQLLIMLADIASNNIPTTGGLLGMIMGGKDLSGFASALPKLAEGLAAYVTKLDEAGFTDEQMAKSVRLTNMLTSLGRVSDQLGDGSKLLTFGGSLKGFGEYIKDFLRDYFEVQDSLELVNPELFRSKIVAIVNAYSELIYMLEAMPNGVSIDFSGVVKDLTKATADIGDMGASMVDKLSSSMKSAKTTLSTELSGISSTVSSSFSKMSQLFTTAGTNMANNFSKSFKNGSKQFTNAVKSVMTTALNTINGQTVKGQWKRAGETLAKELAKGIENKKSSVRKAGESLGKEGANGAKQSKHSFESAGASIASGLARGIRNGQSGVISAAVDVAVNAYKAAKKALDINSPSKLFAKLGEGIDEGYVKGMADKEHIVTSKSIDLVKQMINTSQDALYRLGDLIDSDVIDDPTITPVMDLSQIQNGANKLYSMMSDAERYSFHGDVDLANSTSRSVSAERRRQREAETASMDSLVNAINGLTALIGNTGNTYNVNGVTYDDGSNVSSAVRSLIRAVRVEGRA